MLTVIYIWNYKSVMKYLNITCTQANKLYINNRRIADNPNHIWNYNCYNRVKLLIPNTIRHQLVKRKIRDSVLAQSGPCLSFIWRLVYLLKQLFWCNCSNLFNMLHVVCYPWDSLSLRSSFKSSHNRQSLIFQSIVCTLYNFPLEIL